MEGYYTGRVSAVDRRKGLIRVTYPGENNIVSDWMPMMYFEYDMPKVGEYVAISTDSNRNAICFGKVFSNEQHPIVDHGYGKVIDEGPDEVKVTKVDKKFHVQFDQENKEYMNYDAEKKNLEIQVAGTITLKASKIVLDGWQCKNCTG